jgi:hypothetical protein
MRANKGWIVGVLSIALAGCGEALSGRFADDAGVTNYTFARNGRVTISVLGTDVDAEYRLDGDKVMVSSAQGTVVLTRREDRLYGPMGLELKRQNRGE